MGLIYRAEHESSGALVALKTVRGPAPSTVAGIRREIHRLRRLAHPGVVRILDDGVHDGLPWYAMDLLEGTTWPGGTSIPWLETATQLSPGDHEATLLSDPTVDETPRSERSLAWRQRPVRPERFLDLARVTVGLCDALAYIHGEGIVHRDLKPANVIVRESGEPVLVDFGLVVAYAGSDGREVLEVDALWAGTPAYVAPEQLREDAVDARTDLFALGCMLYEAVTGEAPFPRSWEKRRKSAFDPPPSPRSLAGWIPPEVDRLLLTMLQRDPRDRIGHADDVAAVLSAAAGWGDRRTPKPRARSYVYRARFAGRAEAAATLGRRVELLRFSGGGLVVVQGESGSGKTRLVTEVVRRAASSETLIVGCECARHGAGGAAPLGPLRPVLARVADLCRDEGADTTERLLGPHLPVLAPFEPLLWRLPGADRWPEPPALPHEAKKHRVLTAMRATLAALAERSPVLVVIDDLQWADPLTLDLLAHLCGAFDDLPVLVVGTLRTEEISEAARSLTSHAGVANVALDALDDATVGVLVADILGDRQPPHALTSFIATRAAGNPYFISEYLRGAVEEGLLTRNTQGGWVLAGGTEQGWIAELARLEFPGTLRALIERRLGALGGSLSALVDVASVLGREVDEALLAEVGGYHDVAHPAFVDALDELTQRHIFTAAGDGRWRFAHDKLCEIGYERVERARRRALHRAIAEASEARGVGQDGLGDLARHFAEGAVPDKAREYFRLAGAHALSVGAHRTAAGLLGRALELADPRASPLSPDGAAQLGAMLAGALWGAGNTQSGAAAAQRALALLGAPVPVGKRGAALRLAAEIAEQLGRALGIVPSGAPRDEALALATADAAVVLAQCCIAAHRPQLDVMLSVVFAANLADRAGARGPKSVPYSVLGTTLGMMGLHGGARRYFDRARADATARGDRSAYAATGIMEASYWQTIGRWDALAERTDECAAIASSVGDRPAWEALQLIRGGASVAIGDLADGGRRLEEVRRSAGARGGHYMHAWATVLLSLHELWAGRRSAALDLACAAEREFGQDGGTSVANALAIEAAVHAEEGDVDAALRAVDSAMALLERGPLLFQLWPACDLLATLLLDRWEQAEAGEDPRPLRARATKACTLVRRLVWTSPMASPIAQRIAGAKAALVGRRRSAARRLDAAVESAQRLGMALAEGQARIERARISPARREDDLRAARAIAERTGASRLSRRIEIVLRPGNPA